MLETLTDAEHWQLRCMLDDIGEPESARRLGVTVPEMCAAIWPGIESEILEKIRQRIKSRRDPIVNAPVKTKKKGAKK